MAIPSSSCFHYHTVLHADRDGNWVGVADEDGSASLLGSGPSVVVTNGRVTMTRRQRALVKRTEDSQASFDGDSVLTAVLRHLKRTENSQASFDGGEALTAVLRQEDRLPKRRRRTPRSRAARRTLPPGNN